MLKVLNDKTADIELFAERAFQDPNLVADLIAGLTDKNENFRYNCSKVLHVIGQKQPGLIYPYWDSLAGLLTSQNSYHRMSAVNHLAYLTAVDEDNKFSRIFDEYYRLLDDQSVIVAIYVAQASGRIALAKPEMQKEITEKLLGVDRTHHLPGRKDLIKAGIIASFNQYYAAYPGKSVMLDFVKNQIESDSPKTRNIAKSFMKKWGK